MKHFNNFAIYRTEYHPHSTVILKEYFENITLKSCNIAKIFIKLLERFLEYCRNLAMSVQDVYIFKNKRIKKHNKNKSIFS